MEKKETVVGIAKKTFDWITGANLTPEEKKAKWDKFDKLVSGEKGNDDGRPDFEEIVTGIPSKKKNSPGKLKKRIIEEYY